MIPLLVLRPEPGAAATAARAHALGLETIVAPLFAIRAVEPGLSGLAPPEALLLTSTNAARMLTGAAPRPTRHPGLELGASPPPHRHAGPVPASTVPHIEKPLSWDDGDPRNKALLSDVEGSGVTEDAPATWRTRLARLPVYAVGEATAAAARRAGFAHVVAGSGDAAAIVARAAADGVRRLLHLAGREHRAVTHPSLTIDRAIVYAADPVALTPQAQAALQRRTVALVHSPRAAARLAALVPDRAPHAIAAISWAAADAAGSGWRTIAVAPVPTDAALLAVAARLCEGGG